MNEHDVILIEQYLDGELPESEMQKVKARIGQDKEFAELVEYIEDVRNTMAYSSKQEFKEKLKSIAATHEAEQTAGENSNADLPDAGQKTNSNFRILAIAATLTAVFFTVIIFLLIDNDSQPLTAENDRQYINKLLAEQPENIIKADTELLPIEMLNVFGSELPDDFSHIDIQHQPGQKPEISAIIILKNTNFKQSYFLTDTLFLFGDFVENSLLFYDYDSLNQRKQIILRDGFEHYQLMVEKTDTITPLTKIEGTLENLRPDETN